MEILNEYVWNYQTIHYRRTYVYILYIYMDIYSDMKTRCSHYQAFMI